MPLFGKKTLSNAEKERLLMQAHNLQGQGEEYRVQKKDLPRAREYYEKSLQVFRQTNEPLAIGRVLQGLGMIHRDMKNYREAEKCLQEALDLFGSIYDTHRQGTTCDRMATMYYMQGDNVRATEMYRKAGDLLIEAGKHEEAMLSLTAAASLDVDLEQPARGEQLMRRALDIVQENRVRREEPHVLFILGKTLVVQGRGSEAIPLFTRVLLLEEEMNESTYAPAADKELKKLGAGVSTEKAQLPTANPQIAAALDLYQRGQVQPAIARLKELLGGYESRNRLEDAAAAGEQLGAIQQSLGHTADALQAYQQALVRYQKAGRQDAVGRLNMLIGMLQQEKDKFDL